MKKIIDILYEKEIRELKIKTIFSIILGITGIGLIIYFSNWQTSLGVFLMIWGNNSQIK